MSEHLWKVRKLIEVAILVLIFVAPFFSNLAEGFFLIVIAYHMSKKVWHERRHDEKDQIDR